jgi:hypothetical protein
MTTKSNNRSSKWQLFCMLSLTLQIGTFVAILVPTLTICVYVFHFWRNNISADPGDWADFGSYIGGVLGWLLSLLALSAVYVTYLQQKQDAIEQQRHSNKMVALLQTQNENLANQVSILMKDSFHQRISGKMLQLIQSILGCQREHLTLGTLVGHAHFNELAKGMWSKYVDHYNNLQTSEPLRSARGSVFLIEVASWLSVRNQIEHILRIIKHSQLLTEYERWQAITDVANQLTSGIATFFAIDMCLSNDKELLELSQKYGLLQHVGSQFRDVFLEDYNFPNEAFEDQRKNL